MTTESHSNADYAESLIERLIFQNRAIVLAIFLGISAFFAYEAVQIRPDASLERMIPLEHPYVVNFLEHRDDLENLANFIRVSVEAKEGDIFDADYMALLQKISDEIFYLPGVDRAGLKSLWTPNVRWVEVTEEGFQGGPVIPQSYNGDENSINQLRQNILRSAHVGRLVANDFKSSIVYVPLLETNPETGERLDYLKFSRELESKVRNQYGAPDSIVQIHIVGFAKKIGDLIEGLGAIVNFFLIAVGITTLLLFVYCRCWKSTISSVIASLISVVWQLGLLHVLGYGLDPYSMLIPFIVFATAISHGVQFINGVMHDVGIGHSSLSASQRTFKHHFKPAMLALISDAIGFFTLVLIEVDVIKDLAVGASVGIASIIFTNMILLPVMVSYFGVSQQGLNHAQYVEKHPSKAWKVMAKTATRKYAFLVILISQIGIGFGLYVSQDLKIGELEEGAPELHPDSRYNLDNKFITSNYSTSADVLVVMVKTEEQQCSQYAAMDAMERLHWDLENTEGVQSVVSIVSVSKQVTKALNEGNFKWMALSRNQVFLDSSIDRAPEGFMNATCSLVPLFVFLNDHRAETLQSAVDTVENFINNFEQDNVTFLLAAGNAGIEVATNQVIEQSQDFMMIFVYGVVSLMVILAYRSLRSVFCIVLPLGVTSILCTALMAYLEIGVKVSTLPIIALGVGLGVDYGIYIFSRLKELMDKGECLIEAYFDTLRSTGKAVAFTGLTLAIGTATWIFSPIKFQSDMGILLTFMFLWNMVGALTLLPALSYYFLKDPKSLDVDGEAIVEQKAQAQD